jgi:murein DD-endopeptidase MepM/ murein hydrolase activator NlpD
MKDYREAAKNLPAAEAALKTAKAALARAKAADASAHQELTKVITKSDKAETKLNTTISKLDTQKVEVTKLIRSVYRQGPMSELTMILSSQTPGEFTARVAAVNSWTDSKRALISNLAATQTTLAYQTKYLASLQQKKAQKKAQAEALVLDALTAAKQAIIAQNKVNRIVAKKQAAMKIALRHRSAVKKRYEALKREQKRLKDLANNANNAGSGLSGNDNFLWPVSGANVTQYTGWRTHPVYGYHSCHTGIDLGASSGTPIRSVEDGIVGYVGNGGPYGRYTLISHGEGIVTFYAHQSRQAVKEGDRVKRGEIIGYVGTTGWSTGAHLHFEVRKNGTPYDPMGWFGGKKSKVSCVD